MTDAPRKKRIRRTAEERLAELDRKKQEILARQQEQLAKLEEQKRRLTQTPALRKERLEKQKRLYRALAILAPQWDERQVIAAVEKCLSEDAEALASRGDQLLAEHGKARRGRKPKNG
ncbi:hypothetical protein [Candidatus Igneacidithiobacillus taiwanensis]|uniref:hypothetical protein n=1 Tax=Candidatus Igneacidithiobacillus taiwanensis TaxID=1945924 RepID=UPI0028A2A951|nr:hypothetical protein [Candidatus Igneacidithiobacillus taiwanensis]